MPELLAQQFIPIIEDTKNVENNALTLLFAALNLTSNLSITTLTLTSLQELFNLDNSSNTVSMVLPDNIQFLEKWLFWKDTINLALNNDVLIDQNITHIAKHRSLTPLLDIFLFEDPDEPNIENSSDIQGLKLITLILLIYQLDIKPELGIEKIIKRFRSSIGIIHKFEELNLNFLLGGNPEEIIAACKFLVEKKYSDPSSEREFLDHLKNTLIILAGFQLGSSLKKPKKGLPHKFDNRVKESTPRKPKEVRHTPYYLEDEKEIIGTPVEITTEEGEAPVAGLITRSNKKDDALINHKISSSSVKVKNKYWQQSFNKSVPYSNFGINPMTRSILIAWIKSNNNDVSLIFSLMLATGRSFKETLRSSYGKDGYINESGEIQRTYVPPSNSVTPSEKQKDIVIKAKNSFKLSLPDMLFERLDARIRKSKSSYSFIDKLNLDYDAIKKDAQHVISHLIKNGGQGLGLDRIHLSFAKRLAAISADEVIWHMIAGAEEDMPAVSNYYSSIPHGHLEAYYYCVVKDLYK